MVKEQAQGCLVMPYKEQGCGPDHASSVSGISFGS